MELYTALEDYKLSDYSYSCFENVKADNEEEDKTICYERGLLAMSSGYAMKNWTEENRIFARTYLEQRFQATQNPHLLVKYGLQLFYLTNDYRLLSQVITKGKEALMELLQNDRSDAASAFCQWFKILYPLSKRTKQSNEIELVLLSAIRREDSRFKGYVLSMIYYSDVDTSTSQGQIEGVKDAPLRLGKLFDTNELAEMAMVRVRSGSLKRAEHQLTIAAYYAEKAQNKNLIREANGTLGDYWMNEVSPDNFQNLAIAHMNSDAIRKAMAFYKIQGAFGFHEFTKVN